MLNVRFTVLTKKSKLNFKYHFICIMAYSIYNNTLEPTSKKVYKNNLSFLVRKLFDSDYQSPLFLKQVAFVEKPHVKINSYKKTWIFSSY